MFSADLRDLCGCLAQCGAQLVRYFVRLQRHSRDFGDSSSGMIRRKQDSSILSTCYLMGGDSQSRPTYQHDAVGSESRGQDPETGR
jgi:hypothetical protein